MLIIDTLPLLRQQIRRFRQEGKRIALVPTMGNLHEGHLTLVEQAKASADIVIVSIFVNPMQFERQDDLAHYPRTLQEDCEKLSRKKINMVFTPAATDIYPQGVDSQTTVDVPVLSTILEGESRPGHFRGVSTIVSKLFNLVQPDVAFFGEKDYQQLALIRKMVADMAYDIEIIGVPTVRAKDGLALSSRNGYLNSDERKVAPVLNQVINTLAQSLLNGQRDIESMVQQANQKLEQEGFRPDALDVRDADTLQPLSDNSKRAVILIAAWLGKARLIDNLVVNLIP